MTEYKKGCRRYYTDPLYRRIIQTSARERLNERRNFEQMLSAPDELDEEGMREYNPAVDVADLSAKAIIAELENRSGATIYPADPVEEAELVDTVSEIIRQGIKSSGYSPYELIDTPRILPRYDDEYIHEMESSMDPYTPREIRQQLFDAFTDAALRNSADNRLLNSEKCLKTVNDVLSIIDGERGNGPDGKGLPLFQLLPSPHPDYTDARIRQGERVYGNELPLDSGLISSENSTGLARAFREHYEDRFVKDIESRNFKAAKELFGE